MCKINLDTLHRKKKEHKIIQRTTTIESLAIIKR